MDSMRPAIVFYSANQKRLVRFYERLGFPFVKEKHGRGPLHYACDFGGMVLEIYPLRIKHTEQVRVCGLDHAIVIPTHDFDGTWQKVRRLACVHGEPAYTDRRRSIQIADPDGRIVLLVELLPDD